jgi:hypothetical protein
MLVEVHTLGGWTRTLKVQALPQGTALVLDQRLSLTHLLDLPVMPFSLSTGGLGLINTSNVTHMRVCPTPEVLPGNAIPAVLVRWTRRGEAGTGAGRGTKRT